MRLLERLMPPQKGTAEKPPVEVIQAVHAPAARLEFTESQSFPQRIPAAFGVNRTIVTGGNIELPNGQTIHTDGIFGRAIRQIISKRNTFSQEREALVEAQTRDGKRWFLNPLDRTWRSTLAIRDAEAQRKFIAGAQAEAEKPIRKQIEEQQKKIAEFCDKRKVAPDQKQRFDTFLALETKLEDPTTELADLENLLDQVHFPQQLRTNKEAIYHHVLLVPSAIAAYDDYKNLIKGYNKEGSHIKGLIDYEKDLVEERAKSEEPLKDAHTKLAEAKRNAAQWEAKAKELRLKGKTSKAENELSDRVAELMKIEEAINTNYAPDPDKLNEAQKTLASTEEMYEAAHNTTANISTFLQDVLGNNRLARKVEKALKKRSNQAIDQINKLTNPKRRIPQQLQKYATAISSPDFNVSDIENLPENERPLAEAAMVLMGYGEAQIDQVKPIQLLGDWPEPLHPTEEAAASETARPAAEILKQLRNGQLHLEEIRNLQLDPRIREEIELPLLDIFYAECTAPENNRSTEEIMRGIIDANASNLQGIIPDLIIQVLADFLQQVPELSNRIPLQGIDSIKVDFNELKEQYRGRGEDINQFDRAEKYLLLASTAAESYHPF